MNCIYICICTYNHICIYIYICVCVFVCMYVPFVRYNIMASNLMSYFPATLSMMFAY